MEVDTITKKLSNFEKKKEKKRLAEKRRKEEKKVQRTEKQNAIDEPITEESSAPAIEIDYVIEDPDIELEFEEGDQNLESFSRVIEKFKAGEDEQEESTEAKTEDTADAPKDEVMEAPKPKLSNKQLKKAKRLNVAVLKQLVKRPDVVELHDANSSDPVFLINLKSVRNSVPVPKHWCQKRRYLQNKRGFIKPPFPLPDFITATGITKMREAVAEKEDAKSLKMKMRERMRPKMGKISIDYTVLQDAFFKYQTKPKMTVFGDIYYEGKENEVSLREHRPGELSEELKKALGMTDGLPPPYLTNMQRVGPPPSYPNMKIAGLNAPIPEGAQWGYHPGGWGRAPVDDVGNPLYGDVYGMMVPRPPPEATQPIEKKHWGEVDTFEEEEEEVQEGEEGPEDEEEGSKEDAEMGEIDESAPSVAPTPATPVVATSVLARTPADALNITKQTGEKQLYTELKMEQAKTGGGLLGTSFKYNIPGAIVPSAGNDDDEDDDDSMTGGTETDKKKDKKDKKKKGFKF